MTEEIKYASMDQLSLMKRLGFPPQPTTLTMRGAYLMISEKLTKDKKPEGNGPVDAPVEKFTTPRIPAQNGVTQAEVEKHVSQARNGAKEYHLSPEEVKCRALESAIAVSVMGEWKATEENVLQTADKFVGWINGN